MTERRRNVLSGEWVVVSPDRLERPWQGAAEPVSKPTLPGHDPNCYLCPGTTRARGTQNPDYVGAFVFDNDFPALMPVAGAPPESAPEIAESDELLTREVATGTCRVICYSEQHNASLASLDPGALNAVVDLWCAQVEELGSTYPWVQVFENRGQMMGCSNEHPHGQIWASSFVPGLVERENERQLEHSARTGSNLLHDYAEREQTLGDRIVHANPHWLAIVPFWASWPFETLIVPVDACAGFVDLTPAQRVGLADLISILMPGYDELFETPMPYSMGWHGAPASQGPEHWTLHGHVYPPLLRSASIRKFMVGYEVLAEPQRDLTPEAAAERLRAAVRAAQLN